VKVPGASGIWARAMRGKGALRAARVVIVASRYTRLRSLDLIVGTPSDQQHRLSVAAASTCWALS
jgi:hypothetical protein